MSLGRLVRGALRSASPPHLVVAMVLAATGGSASAGDLPALLLAAARLMPATQEGSVKCYRLGDRGNGPRLPYAMGEHRTGVAGTAEYSASTVGAYLGAVSRGAPASPLVQALVDAGVARLIPLTWLQHTLLPGQHAPTQQDVEGTPASPRAAPADDRITSVDGDVFVVAGADQRLFPRPEPGASSGSPPALDGSGAGPDFSADAQRPPAGVWEPDRMCFQYSAVRILEYGDPEQQPNGLLTISAAVLFQASGMPAWAMTYQVAAALPEYPLPFEVRFLSFRNDGDGWRPQPFGNGLFLRGRTHLMPGNED